MATIPLKLLENGWAIEASGNALAKTFRFPGFRDAMSWMQRVAFEAEEMDHHPEWSNASRTVKVRLTTHDASALTGKDFELARRMDRLAPAG